MAGNYNSGNKKPECPSCETSTLDSVYLRYNYNDEDHKKIVWSRQDDYYRCSLCNLFYYFDKINNYVYTLNAKKFIKLEKKGD